VTERYDGVRWHLHRLHRQMLATAVRLAAAERQLAYQRAMLSQLLVQQYKSGDPQTLDIVMGASSLTQASNLADASAQLDASVTATVDAIRSARDSIVLQRADLGIERHHALLAERALARMRARLRAELRVRHRLARSIHAQLLAVMAAQRLHQARSALEATVWLQQDIRVDRPDPAQVMRDQVAIEAVQEVGVPYVWGGASPTAGFDCSGLAMWLYARHGIALPHFAASQYAIGRKVPIADMRPGDLVFFHHLGHVAVYIGEGYVVQAPHVGGFVEITPLTDPWLEANLVGATEPGAA
ncbi:MAG TPA: C40 family peptidase, partial [Gaiellales bacterium]|nr:C40 family peptidase [Gaiellales bacterium]